MLEHVRSIVAAIARRFHSRAVLELKNLALRHQRHVLLGRRPGRLRMIMIERLLWVWLYRLRPRCLDTMVWSSRLPLSSGTVKDSACSGAGVRDRDGRQFKQRHEVYGPITRKTYRSSAPPSR
jgi:hypothetical protein